MLSAMQWAVLQWIADGTPEGVMEGHAHRISAASLKARRLVTISGRGPTWKARITDAGAELLTTASKDAAARSKLSPTEELIADIVAAGGVLRPPASDHADGSNYARLVASAQRFGQGASR